jgi:hypothetical protein
VLNVIVHNTIVRAFTRFGKCQLRLCGHCSKLKGAGIAPDALPCSCRKKA